GTSYFYNVVTKDTIEVEYARQRKLFLLRQGYEYEVEKQSFDTRSGLATG
ncbi:MAG: hypothetical protein ABEK50_18330, partial [bacterium]